MTSPILTTRAQFAQLTQELLPPIQRLEAYLTAVETSKGAQMTQDQAVTDIQQLKKIVSKLIASQSVTLCEAEYVLFCDLIICGSEMAAHFADNPNASKTMQKHGQYWQKSVKEFKSFLKEVLTQHPELRIASQPKNH